jgi:putative hydroxymethylpyrimidine transport system substrate-binding protein
MPLTRLIASAACVLALALAAAGCGGTAGPSDARPNEDASLLLDGPPAAVDAGIYLGTERGYDQSEGVRLDVQRPETPSSGVRALLDGRADMAILDVHDLALARERDRDLVGVMAIVQTPLAAVIAESAVRRARDLDGRRVGVSGRPGDAAVLAAIVRADGGDPSKLKLVRVGSRGSAALRSGRVDAIVGDWTAEGVALRAEHAGIRVFRIDRLNPPPYPEIVLATSRETLTTRGPVVRATVRMLRRGYEAAIDDPQSAISALMDGGAPGTRDELSRELDAVSPSFAAGARHVGELDPAKLAAWARWEQRAGIVPRTPDVASMFDPATSRTGESIDPDA